MARVLVVGSNRGIGLEVVKALNAQGHEVHAACRKSSDALKALEVPVHEAVDVTDEKSLNALAEKVGELDALWVVAGVLERNSLGALDVPSIKKQFEINAVGPLQTVEALRSKMKKGSKVALLTSRMGSISDNTSGGMYGYRMSKAALNMAGRSLSHDLRNDEIALTLLHPGYVKTDMTGNQGHIDAAESAAGLISQVEALTLEDSGVFVHQSGERLEW